MQILTTTIKNYEKLVIKWNIAEYNLFIKKKQKKQKKHSPKNKFLTCVPTQINTEGVTMIPLDIKKIYIRCLLKRKIHELVESLKADKITCTKIDEINEEKKWEIEGLIANALKNPEKPKIASLLDLITEDQYFNLIQTAQQNRLEWNSLLNIEKTQISKSYCHSK